MTTLPKTHSTTAFPILIGIGLVHLMNDLIQTILPAIYPMIKEKLDKIHKTVLLLLAKVLLFNGLVFFMYSLILFVFPISEIVQEFATSSFALTIGLVLLSNFVFLLYDFALVRVRLLYEYRLRPLLFGGAR